MVLYSPSFRFPWIIFPTGFIVYMYLLSLLSSVSSDCSVDPRQNSFLPADLFPPEYLVTSDNHRSHFQTDNSPDLPVHERLVVPPRSRPRLLGFGSSTTTRPKDLRPYSTALQCFYDFLFRAYSSHIIERDNRHISNCRSLLEPDVQ